MIKVTVVTALNNDELAERLNAIVGRLISVHMPWGYEYRVIYEQPEPLSRNDVLRILSRAGAIDATALFASQESNQ